MSTLNHEERLNDPQGLQDGRCLCRNGGIGRSRLLAGCAVLGGFGGGHRPLLLMNVKRLECQLNQEERLNDPQGLQDGRCRKTRVN